VILAEKAIPGNHSIHGKSRTLESREQKFQNRMLTCWHSKKLKSCDVKLNAEIGY
jgi:hypothetical protein